MGGTVAVVAGVGRGVGAAVARSLADEGASVVLAARSRSVVEPLARELGPSSLPVLADVADPRSCQDLVDQALRRFGRIDVVVSNVGLVGPRTSASDGDPGSWLEVVDLNALGPLRVVQAAVPALVARGAGSIVVIGSMVVRSPRHHPGRGAYAASKAALQSIAHTMAEELGPSGIRVNTVAPGWIWGPALIEGAATERSAATGRSLEEVHDELASAVPLRRLARPEDVAQAVTFLASERASAITGQTLHVNGGEVFG